MLIDGRTNGKADIGCMLADGRTDRRRCILIAGRTNGKADIGCMLADGRTNGQTDGQTD